MTEEIAILIPTLNRSQKLKRVVEDIHQNTTVKHTIYFILEKEDQKSIDKVTELGEKYLINKNKHYVGAINYGYQNTKEPFIFCASDDLEFNRGWDKAVLKCFKNSRIGFVGVKDSWSITKSGYHASHFCVRRTYIEKFGGVEDEKNTIYSSQYRHNMCDIETEQTAMKRKAFCMSEGTVEHRHWFNDKEPMDATYELAKIQMTDDKKTYENRRRNFEQYLFEGLWHNKVWRVNQGTLSIVIPSYNQVEYLKQTINSLFANTYTDFELIIIDDNSNKETKEYLLKLREEYEDLILIFNKTNKYTNYNWNKGVRLAQGHYIAVLNNDITLSENWDVPLMNALDNGATLANPYQTDPGLSSPYPKHARSGNIDIRGAGFMFKREFKKYFPIPEQLLMWCGDSWLAWLVVDVLKEKSVFVPESIIHHFGSKSSLELEKKTGKYHTICQEDIKKFERIQNEYIKSGKYY